MMKKTPVVSSRFALVALVLFLGAAACEKKEATPPQAAGPVLTGAAAGEALFAQKCAICHNPGAVGKVGPGLKGATDRHTDEWLALWIGDPEATWAAGSPETEAMKAALGKTGVRMTAMKNRELSAGEIADLIAFLKKNDGK